MKLFVNMHEQSSPAGCRPEATSFIKTYTCIHLIHKQSIYLNSTLSWNFVLQHTGSHLISQPIQTIAWTWNHMFQRSPHKKALTILKYSPSNGCSSWGKNDEPRWGYCNWIVSDTSWQIVHGVQRFKWDPACAAKWEQRPHKLSSADCFRRTRVRKSASTAPIGQATPPLLGSAHFNPWWKYTLLILIGQAHGQQIFDARQHTYW